jgi:hypothetical protein
MGRDAQLHPTHESNAGRSRGVPDWASRQAKRRPSRAASGSSIPHLAPLPLHGNAGGIADFNPDAVRAGSIGTVNPLGNDALCAKPARMGKHGRPIFENVLVKQDGASV